MNLYAEITITLLGPVVLVVVGVIAVNAWAFVAARIATWGMKP